MLTTAFSTRLKFASAVRPVPAAGQRLLPALLAGLLWLLVGLSAGYWLLRLVGSSPLQAVQSLSVAAPVSDPALVALALGALAPAPEQVAAAPPAASRVRLFGLVLRPGQQGVALLGVDGQPERPYRVGAPVVDGWLLQSVQGRVARLGREIKGRTELELSLPDPATVRSGESALAPVAPRASPMFAPRDLPQGMDPGVKPAKADEVDPATGSTEGKFSGDCQGTVC